MGVEQCLFERRRAFDGEMMDEGGGKVWCGVVWCGKVLSVKVRLGKVRLGKVRQGDKVCSRYAALSPHVYLSEISQTTMLFKNGGRNLQRRLSLMPNFSLETHRDMKGGI